MKTIESVRALLYRPEEASWPLVERMLSINFPEKITYCDEADLSSKISSLMSKGLSSKEIMVMKEFRGRFFQVCPKTPLMICCNYRLINTGFNCLYDCAYCYLQSYLNSSGIMLFSNMHEVLSELENFFNSIDASLVYRIGTGEYTDSLMIDEFTGIGRMLIEKSAQRKNVMLELKTKSCNVRHLLDVENKGNAVISFTLNSADISAMYESGAATVCERIEAAALCAENGYYVAFHFDPIVYSDSFERDYAAVVDMIFGKVRAASIVWVSFGGFRFSPSFREIVTRNHPHEKLTLGELLAGEDGKYRYFAPLRRRIYMHMKSLFERPGYRGYSYLCMESARMWDDVFGKHFESSDDLERDFSLAMRDAFLADK